MEYNIEVNSMDKKWMFLLVAIGACVVFIGAKGITGAVTGDVSGAGLLSRTTVVSVVAIIAIAGLVITTQVVNKK